MDVVKVQVWALTFSPECMSQHPLCPWRPTVCLSNGIAGTPKWEPIKLGWGVVPTGSGPIKLTELRVLFCTGAGEPRGASL